MHSFRWILTSLGTAGLLVGMVLLSGCGGGSTGPGEDDEAKTEKKKPVKLTGLAIGKGSIKGRVTLAAGKTLDIAKMNEELVTLIKAKAGQDLTQCLDMAPPEQKEEQTWVLSKDGGVGNVFVFLRPAKGSYFAVDAKDPGVQAAKGKEAVLDQPHCAFVPHALIYFPSYFNAKHTKEETGEKFVVKNSAKISHNTKLDGGPNNSGFPNSIIPPGGKVDTLDLKPDKLPVTVQCNVHPWMDAYVWVLDHPYFALTDKDGNFEIKNVPAGDVHIVAWHEKARFINSKGADGEPIKTDDKELVKNFVIDKTE